MKKILGKLLCVLGFHKINCAYHAGGWVCYCEREGCDYEDTDEDWLDRQR